MGDLGDGDLFGRVSDTVSLDVLVGPGSGPLGTVLRHRADQSGSDQQRPPLPGAKQGPRMRATDPVGELQIGLVVAVALGVFADDGDEPAGQRDGAWPVSDFG